MGSDGIKEVRGIRRFRFRGLERTSGEWKLICATHNLLKLFRYRRAKDPDTAANAAGAPLLGHLALRVALFLTILLPRSSYSGRAAEAASA